MTVAAKEEPHTTVFTPTPSSFSFTQLGSVTAGDCHRVRTRRARERAPFMMNARPRHSLCVAIRESNGCAVSAHGRHNTAVPPIETHDDLETDTQPLMRDHRADIRALRVRLLLIVRGIWHLRAGGTLPQRGVNHKTTDFSELVGNVKRVRKKFGEFSLAGWNSGAAGSK